MTRERIEEILGTGKHLKVRHKVRGIGCMDTELGSPKFDDSDDIILHTDNWANDFYRIPYADITDIKPKGAKTWLR